MDQDQEDLLYQIDKIKKKIKKISTAAGLTRRICKIERNIPANTTHTILDTTVNEMTRGRGIHLSFLAVGSGTLTVTISVSGVTDTLTFTAYPASAALCRRLDVGDRSVQVSLRATGAISYAEANAELVDLWEDHYGE